MAITSWTETQAAAARAAPTLITEGISLDKAKGYQVIVSAVTGQTLSGAGTLDSYYWNTALAAWVKGPTLAVSSSGIRRMTFAPVSVFLPTGRIFFAANGVTISGGTNVDVRVDVHVP